MADLSPRPVAPASSPTRPAYVPPLDIARSVARAMLDQYATPRSGTGYAEAYGALKASLESVLAALDTEQGEGR